MNDLEYERTRDRVRLWLAYWPDMLGLNNWDITIKYCREGLSGRVPYEGSEALMVVHPEWAYLKAEIEIDMPALHRYLDPDTQEHDDDYAELAFVHELTHCILCQNSLSDKDNEDPTIREYRIKLEELSTHMVAKALMRLKDHLVGQRNLLLADVNGLLVMSEQTEKNVLTAGKDEHLVALAIQEHREFTRRTQEDLERRGYGPHKAN